MASEREARIEAALLEMARGIDEDDGLPCWCPSPTLAAFNRKHPDWDGGKYPETAGHLPFCGRMRAALAALQDGASGHVCARPSTCKCSPVGDEPNELCPVHGGGEWPPRCAECGRLMSWPASSQDAGMGGCFAKGASRACARSFRSSEPKV